MARANPSPRCSLSKVSKDPPSVEYELLITHQDTAAQVRTRAERLLPDGL